MKINKPDWVSHENSPVYSIHVRPNENRLATGGADSKVKIWNMQCILDEKFEGPKMMWAGTHHNGAVNCVRWSPCGNYLATCSDDNTVAVLRYAGKFDYVPLGQKEANPETWEVHKQYQGHEKDVLHVAWNQSGSMLASSGVDNLIFVWTLESLAPVRRLQASGMVKGVAWDPIGKYLAAQVTGGEEKSANLWRLRDWQLEMKSTGPFDAAPDETMFLRLCWSPDGQQLATTNAFIKNKPCATLLERSVGAADAADGEPWENKISMKGFTAPVTVAAYHPKLLVRHDELDAVCAVGGVEGRLVVWSSLKPEKPLVIISDLFKRQILDATWSDQGYTLALCSDDGTVALILYDPKEVGRIATKAETTKHLQQLYGDVLSSAADADLPEDIGQLSFESITASATTHINGAGAAPQMVRNQQVESKRGGKRRIEPRVLAGKRDEADLAAVALPAATALAPASDSAPAPEAAARPAAPHAAGEAAAAAGPGGAAHAPGAPAPRDVMAGSQPFTNHKVPAAAASAGGAVGALAVAASSSVVPVSKEKVKEANQAALESRKRKDPRGGGGKEDKRARSGEGPDVHGGAGGAGVNLIPPRGGGQPRTSVTKVVAPAVDGQEGALVLRTERSATGWTQISQGRDNGAPAAWTDVLYDTVEALAGNGRVAAVACTEGTLYFFSEAGRRALPAMLLPARVAFLEAAPAPSQCVAALTCDGTLLVWDLAAQRERVRTSLAQLLRAGEAVSLLWLTPGGQPVVAFKSGHCYTFHAGMQCMVRVADDHFRPSKFAAVGTGGVGGAGQLQRAIEIAARPEHPRAIAGMLALDPGQVDDISRAHLETQLASALALGDGAELQVRLAAYARWLVDTEDEVRLREMCEMVFPHRLVGRGDAADEGAGGGGAEGPQPRLLGLSRRALVREVLQEMRRKRSLQRCREELALMLGQEA